VLLKFFGQDYLNCNQKIHENLTKDINKKKYTKAYYASNFLKAKNKLNQILKPKDTVVFMGAGSISSWCNDYAKQFKLEDLNVK